MEQRWDLSKFYDSFTSVALQEDLKKIEQLLSELTELTITAFKSDADIPSVLLAYYQQLDELESLLSHVGSFGQLVYSVDTKDDQALKLIEKVEGYLPLLTPIEVNLKKWLKSIDNLETIIDNNEDLRLYKFSLLTQKRAASHLLSDEEEVLLSSLQNTGSNAWSKLQDATIATLTATYEGEELPITVIRSYAYDKDAKKRKLAYEAELASYKKVDTISAACLNAIKGEVLTVSKKRGFSHPLDMTLMSSRMDKETLDAMFTAIDEYLPVFRAYMKKKATLLGHENGLPFYDLFAPIGSVNMEYTYDEAADFIINNFTAFSDKLGNYAKTAFESRWIDASPRSGKISGAYCSNQHRIKESRIMSNFNNSFSDVSTLAHELGHGYHGDCLKDEVYANSDYPMPLAETASIFAETIVTNAALATATEDEKLVLIENSVMSANQVIVDIYSRYLFETELFAKRETASLSVDELNEAMTNAQKKAYGDGLDPNYLHPYMWACKPHYYSAGYNFYNFPYAFGLLFAKGLYAMYLKEGESFIPKYDELLRATGKNNIVDVLATVGVDAHNPDFFRQSLALIQEEIDYILSK